jgi:hypothetical protein
MNKKYDNNNIIIASRVYFLQHIPTMARNLISLSTLDSEGYNYRGGNKVLKVSKGSSIHMIGDMNSAKLYVLRGST